MNWKRLDEILAGCKSKTLGRRLVAKRGTDGKTVEIWLYSTCILKFTKDGKIFADHGEYKTDMTKRKINDFLPGVYQVFQKGFDWFLQVPNGIVPFPEPNKNILSLGGSK